MVARQSRRHGAFTLVEILIVVAILGILAAIVIPRFAGATDMAKVSNLESQLTAARKQLELWRLDHDGWPTLAEMQGGDADWNIMTDKTDASGAIDAAGAFGPYLGEAPENPFTQSTLVVEAGSPLATAGWTYDEDTGDLRAVIPAEIDPVALDLGVADYEQVP